MPLRTPNALPSRCALTGARDGSAGLTTFSRPWSSGWLWPAVARRWRGRLRPAEAPRRPVTRTHRASRPRRPPRVCRARPGPVRVSSTAGRNSLPRSPSPGRNPHTPALPRHGRRLYPPQCRGPEITDRAWTTAPASGQAVKPAGAAKATPGAMDATIAGAEKLHGYARTLARPVDQPGRRRDPGRDHDVDSAERPRPGAHPAHLGRNRHRHQHRAGPGAVDDGSLQRS